MQSEHSGLRLDTRSLVKDLLITTAEHTDGKRFYSFVRQKTLVCKSHEETVRVWPKPHTWQHYTNFLLKTDSVTNFISRIFQKLNMFFVSVYRQKSIKKGETKFLG